MRTALCSRAAVLVLASASMVEVQLLALEVEVQPRAFSPAQREGKEGIQRPRSISGNLLSCDWVY